MVGQDRYRRARLVLLALVTAASVAIAGKGGEGNDKGGGKPSGQSERRGNSGGAKPGKPQGQSESRGNSGGAKPGKPQGQSEGRGNSGGAKPGKPQGQSEGRGNGNGAKPGKPDGHAEGRDYGDKRRKPVTGSFAPPRGGYTAWRVRTEAVRPRPVFVERVVVLDQRGWGSGWHYGWRNKPAKQVVISTPHYVWREAMYVPVQRPFTQMGCQVRSWGGNTGAVVAHEDRELIVVRDSPEVIVVERGIAYPVYWEEPPVVYEREIYVPVRPAAVSLGLGVAGTGPGLTVGGGYSFSSTW
ncbi:MAG: hypothetical protein HZB16_00060 [Armatimonadetes bacterium]|nr:hypothetical protein [Armatimonadota bacterium]